MAAVAGTPIWVDLGAPDVGAAVRFYGELFGWEADELPDDAGGYTLFRLGGKSVAGVAPLRSPDQPPAWTTYVATDDADATARKVESAHGTVLAPPFDVLDAGRMAVFADPTGAVFGVWESGRHTGAQVFNEPVSLTWNDVATRNAQAAIGFYTEVFGWRTDEQDMGHGATYTRFFNGVRGIGGARQMGDETPAEVPPHWMAYFTVAAVDDVIERAKQLGGSLVAGPVPIPAGRLAVLNDTAGATFSVVEPTEEARRAAETPEGVPV